MKIIMTPKDLVPFTAADVLKSLGMSPEHRFVEPIRSLLKKTKDIARPKAFYLECPVEVLSERSVKIGGETFHSEILVKLIGENTVVYPYVCTCGEELAAFAESFTDAIHHFAMDAIMDFYRKLADLHIRGVLLQHLPEGRVISCAYPGDVVTWEIRDLKKLFNLFGEGAAEIGVSLSEYYMMAPLKTVAGIAFGTEEEFYQCACCNRQNCTQRREPFDEKAYLKNLYRI